MLDAIKSQNVLFLDIETVPQTATFEELPSEVQHLWEKKTAYHRKDEFSPDEFYHRAGIYAEFGKIVCISVGYLRNKESDREFRIKSFFGHEEKSILTDFSKLINAHFSSKEIQLCGHNAKEFDFPFIARRMIINGISLPSQLDMAGKKPWETPFLDTMELWKFGDQKNYTSLDLLAHILGIPTPKEDMNGSEVAKVYWEDNDLERIAKYCCKDVLTTAQIFLKFKGEELLTNSEVQILD